ncbi:MAG TPA: S8 family serine peptidase [Pyrinomonadaceae bacterium]
MFTKAYRKTRQLTALVLVFLLCLGSIRAGITIAGSDGMTSTGADGVNYVGTSGITATGVDGLLTFSPNGITATGVDGIAATGVDGIAATGVDGVTFSGANGITATGVDSTTITRADGITATGVDGVKITGADGTVYRADSVLIRQPNGITATGVDGITATGVDGIAATGVDSRQITHADGITATGVDGLTLNSADGITATGVDGTIFHISPNGITISGVDGIAATGVDGINITGADGIAATGVDGITATGVDSQGLQSVDPELAVRLSNLTDDSNVDAIIVYHQKPTDADLADLINLGVLGGTKYRELPMIALTASKRQLIQISHLRSVRSIYGNRTLQSNLDPYLAMTGTDRVRRDADLTRKNVGLPVSGRGVTVAVLDTGVDGTHSDLSGRVVQNVKLADTQSVSVGFTEPIGVENLPTTDQAYGHGTFVAGLIAGNGARSGGKYAGVAPGANVVGLSAGDLNLSYVLSGFDYLLSHPQLNVRVVNCSFSANTVFDLNDPVNIATKILTDRGVNIVFSAGNTGSAAHTLNPYAVAPWVVSVGATDQYGQLADFSSRGDFGSTLFHPTIVAPGVSVVSLRATSLNVTGTSGLIGADSSRLSPSELPFYTTASGTSFSAPQVAGTIALMLEVNPQLTPQQVRDILQRTATVLPNYFQHEVGAGMLNAHAAVLEAAFPSRRMGEWRASLDTGQVSFVNQQVQQFTGYVPPVGSFETTINVPADSLLASLQTAWGPIGSTSDLALSLYNSGTAKLSDVNTPNKPGLTGKREGLTLRSPAAGQLRVRVANALGSVASTQAQPVSGVLEAVHADYKPLGDLDGLSADARADIYQALRLYALSAYINRFRPGFGVTRGELAAALVKGARVPQYMPAQSHFTDVRDSLTMLFVESAQACPNGALFTDATSGSQFRPDDYTTRLTAAVAFVRAAGLQAEANAAATQPLNVTDASTIPTSLRGYVVVALAHGFMAADSNGAFRAQSNLTRAELAHAIVAISKLTWN